MKILGRLLLGIALLLGCLWSWLRWGEYWTGAKRVTGLVLLAVQTPSPVASDVRILPPQFDLACSNAQAAQDADVAGDALAQSGDQDGARAKYKYANGLMTRCATTTTQPLFRDLFKLSAVWDEVRMTDPDDRAAYQAAMGDARGITETIATQTTFPNIRTIANHQVERLGEMP